jgi:hypothetical protein
VTLKKTNNPKGKRKWFQLVVIVIRLKDFRLHSFKQGIQKVKNPTNSSSLGWEVYIIRSS